MENRLIKRIKEEFNKVPDLIVKKLNYLYWIQFMLFI